MSAYKTVSFGGKSYPVRYDVNALCDFEDLSGKSLVNGSIDMDIRCLRALVYVGLKCGHNFTNKTEKFPLSLQDVGEMVSLNDDTMKNFMAVLEDSLGGNKEDSEKSKKQGE